MDRQIENIVGKDMAQKIQENLDRTQLRDLLVRTRLKNNMRQADVAKKMKTSIAKISRFEDSLDENLKFGEICKYASAVGLEISMMVNDGDLPLSTKIKHCIAEIGRSLDQLNQLARQCEDDYPITNAIDKFRSEVLLNFMIRFEGSEGQERIQMGTQCNARIEDDCPIAVQQTRRMTCQAGA